MIIWLALAAVQVTPVADTPQREVVVTANRLDDTARALAACLARKCPPDQDIAASLAHAENQFVDGGYAKARVTLGDSIGRNKRHAKAYAVPVSDLFRANARVNVHLGEAVLYKSGMIDSLSALKAGLPATDGRVLAQRIEVADADARLRREESALDQYLAVAADAKAAGLPVVEGYARLRRVVLLTAINQYDGGYASDIKKAVHWFANRPDLAAFGAAAELMSARAAVKKGDSTQVDALIASYGRTTKTPQLLYAPVEVQQDSLRSQNASSMTGKLAMDNYDDQWVDISFWVTPEGKVSDVETLRESPKLSGEWAKPIAARIAQRRYAPLRMDKSEPGVLRVERYTLTAYWLKDATGTRLRSREAVPRIEMVDLTAEAAGVSAGPKG